MISDDESSQIAQSVINDNQNFIESYKKKRDAKLNFFVGQGMKASKGSANPQVLYKMFKEKLEEIE